MYRHIHRLDCRSLHHQSQSCRTPKVLMDSGYMHHPRNLVRAQKPVPNAKRRTLKTNKAVLLLRPREIVRPLQAAATSHLVADLCEARHLHIHATGRHLEFLQLVHQGYCPKILIALTTMTHRTKCLGVRAPRSSSGQKNCHLKQANTKMRQMTAGDRLLLLRNVDN